MARIEIYRDEYRADFERLNRDWIEAFFVLEDADREIFRQPNKAVIEPGGEIFFVVDGDGVQGTCAVVPHEPGVFENSHMFLDAGEGHVERGRQLADRGIGSAEPLEDSAAGGIRDGGKGGIEIS